ncbi:MAG: AAA domain-containing protein, partial [Candidatus Helarchaeota archaeon]
MVSNEIHNLYWKNLGINEKEYQKIKTRMYPYKKFYEIYINELRNLNLKFGCEIKNLAVLELEFPEYMEESEKTKVLDKIEKERRVKIENMNLKINDIFKNKKSIFIEKNKITKLFEKNKNFRLSGFSQKIEVKLIDGFLLDFNILKPINEINSNKSEKSRNWLKKSLELFWDGHSKISYIIKEKSEKNIDNKEVSVKLNILRRFRDEKLVLVIPENGDNKIPKNAIFNIRPDDYVEYRKLEAFEKLLEKPEKYQLPLLKLFSDEYNYSEYEPIKIDEWNYLTNENISGTLDQRKFVEIALACKDFAILEGPPGSGKTTTILEIIHQAIKRGMRVLLVASTHVAIDNVLECIDFSRENENETYIFPLRIGYEDRVSEHASKYLIENIVKTEQNRILSYLE